MKLLVDAGNRRVKWALPHSGDSLGGPSGALEFDGADRAPALAAQLASLERPTSVWVSCVAAAKTRDAIADCARGAWSLRPVFISAQKQQSGIVNGYLQPASLGSDRWAALIAAADLLPRQAVIVVDAGTAVTVDLLDAAGLFRGGVIFPGVQTMRRALREQTGNTALDGAAASPRPANPVATDTHSAVAGGALLAVAGGINLAITRQRAALQTDCAVIATGGDAGHIAPLLTSAVKIEPDLVLWGLAVIARGSSR